jgi:solute carrier family 27 (fatty acid transporter), member 1/4
MWEKLYKFESMIIFYLSLAITEIIDSIPTTLSLYQFNDAEGTPVIDISKDLTTILAKASADYPSGGSVQKANHHDKLLYIYTSGTTGLPKAAVITHSRFVFIVAGIHYVSCFKTEDVFYTPLPLYHTAGGVMSVGQALLFGATVVIRKKFSASQYFVDCQKYKCTVSWVWK